MRAKSSTASQKCRTSSELIKRGLSATRAKPVLVARLDAALLQDNPLPPSNATANAPAIRKRGRSSNEDNDSTAREKIKTTERFRSMNVKQLRKEAALHRVAATGNKKELLERLCEADSNSDGVAVISAKEEGNESKEKMVTATKKGAAVLDQWLPDHIKTNYHVLQVSDDVYDTMLIQNNLGHNNNKFCVLQVLQSDDGSSFMVYYRWGRGYNIPKSVADVIDQSNKKMLEQLSGVFYTVIPHDFGFKKMSKLEMVEALGEIEVATKLLNNDTGTQVALGDMAEISTAKYDADKLPEGKLSTKGVGGTEPDISEAKLLEDGVMVPPRKSQTEITQG